MKPKQTFEQAPARNTILIDDDLKIYKYFLAKERRNISEFEDPDSGLYCQVSMSFEHDQAGFLMTFSNYQNTEAFLSNISSRYTILGAGPRGYLLHDDDIGDLALSEGEDLTIRATYGVSELGPAVSDFSSFYDKLLCLTEHMDRLLTAFESTSNNIIVSVPTDSSNRF